MIHWTNQIPFTHLDWVAIWMEIQELLEETRNGNLDGMMEEFSDTCSTTLCVIACKLNISLPIPWNRSAVKWMNREVFWEKYLAYFGLKYKKEYLWYGGNHERVWKRRKVLQLACKDQLNIDLEI